MLDKTFKLTMLAKLLDGVLELVGGILLFFISPAAMHAVVRALTQHELAQDPHDFIATHLLHFALSQTAGTNLFGALYLLSHGLVKIILVVAVLKNKLWAYPWMVAFLLVFIAYQTYRLSYKFSIGLFLLTLFDIFIVFLTIMEYKRHMQSQQSASVS